jgi:hypothetical protein
MSCHSEMPRWRRCRLHRKVRCNAWRSVNVLMQTFSSCFLHLCSSHCLPGRVYVPWKFLTKTLRRSVQSLTLSRGRCSSHVRAESLR